nr:hypothetical protein [Neisseria subflava]
MNYPPLQGFKLVLATLALSLAVFMEVLDSTIANVAVPVIAGIWVRRPRRALG